MQNFIITFKSSFLTVITFGTYMVIYRETGIINITKALQEAFHCLGSLETYIHET